MTIEVKQLIIKSTVLNERQSQQSHERIAVDLEQIRATLLQECRELIAEQLGERRER
jgi:hypothetical protein